MTFATRVFGSILPCCMAVMFFSAPCLARPLVLVPPGPLILATIGASIDGRIGISVWKTQEEAVTKLVTGDAAAVVLPVTVGAALARKADIVLLGAFRENVFALVARDSVADGGWADLRGKEILVAQGRGTVLDSILRSVLPAYGLKPGRDVSLVYAPAPEVAALYRQKRASLVALPEPFASLALEFGGRVLDPQEAWARLTGSSARFPVGGVFALRSRIAADRQELSLVVSAFAESTAWFAKHPEEACDLAGKTFGIPAERFAKALPQIHIAFDPADACSADVAALLARLHDALSPDMPPPPDLSLYRPDSAANPATR
jgi:ABC-type nitrate/sulfonate/bicarbonate transport system substrate-binding protein